MPSAGCAPDGEVAGLDRPDLASRVVGEQGLSGPEQVVAGGAERAIRDGGGRPGCRIDQPRCLLRGGGMGARSAVDLALREQDV